MPSITNLVSNDGPVIEASFTIPIQLEKKLQDEGKILPTATPIRALIDTGASNCVIQKDIPIRLGLTPMDSIKITTPSCKDVDCYRYFLRMILPGHRLMYEGVFTAAPLEGQNIQCLIGRDMLKDGILLYIGNINQFTWSLL
jgi:hypothetical protein